MHIYIHPSSNSPSKDVSMAVSLVYNEIRLLYRYTPKHLSDLMMKQLDQLGVVTYNFAQVTCVALHCCHSSIRCVT